MIVLQGDQFRLASCTRLPMKNKYFAVFSLFLYGRSNIKYILGDKHVVSNVLQVQVILSSTNLICNLLLT